MAPDARRAVLMLAVWMRTVVVVIIKVVEQGGSVNDRESYFEKLGR